MNVFLARIGEAWSVPVFSRRVLAVVAYLLAIAMPGIAAAAACSSTGNGLWTAAIWGAACPVGGPTAADDVTVNLAHAITFPAGVGAYAARSLTFSAPGGAASLTQAAGQSLTIGVGGVIINSSSNTNTTTKAWNINTGSATVNGPVTLQQGSANNSRIARINLTTGPSPAATLTINGNLTFTAGNAARVRIDTTGGSANGQINLSGSFTVNTTGTLAMGTGAAIFNYNGAAAQTVLVGVSSVIYRNLHLNNASAAGATLSASISAANVSGNVLIQGGILNNGGFAVVGGAGDTFNVANGARFNLTGTSAMASGFPTRTFGATSTVSFQGTSQAVASGLIYGHVDIAGTLIKTPAAGTVTVAGNLTINAGTAFNANASDPIINVTGNVTLAGTYTASNQAARPLTIGGNLSLTGTGTYTGNAAPVNLAGNFTQSGTFTSGAGAFTFNGGTAQTLDGTNAATFSNLTINKSANDVSMGAATPSPTVNTTLTLTSGRIVTAGASCAAATPIIVGAAGTIAGGSGTSYVQGALRKNFNANATLNFRAAAGQDEFPVGDASNYTPIEITAGSTSTLGSVTACVTATDHPQVTTPVATTGIDAAKSVNRYWSLTTATINTTAVPVDATFKFNGNFVSVGGDVDNIAATGNFIVENYGTYWRPTTLVAAGATGTRASNIVLSSAISNNNDIAIGEPLAGVTAVPGRYNAFETSTTAGAILGKIQTKVAGTGFSVDVVHVNATKTGVLAVAITVEVRLLNSSGGGVLDANGCNAAWPLIQVLPNFNIPASGRGTIPAATVANSYRSVRFQISSPVGGPYTEIGCSTDLFAIRPASLTISGWDATWATAGTSRALANTGASGGNVHKAAIAASPLPFTLRATPVPASATLYDGSPTTVAGSPTCGTLCTTVGGLSFAAGSWTGSGVRENATANYSEAGTFNLQLEDASYASVDVVDGSSAATRTVPATASAEIGRFVPDHFDVTALVTPVLQTFGSTCASRSFTYIGQPFGYATSPQATILARNAAGATTINYQGGGLWKVADSDITQSYSNNAVGPALDTALIGTPSVTDNSNGTGTVTFSAGTLAYQRSTAAPIVPFNANLSLTVSAQDASENAVPDNGIISTTTPLVFNGGGTGIAFDSGNAFRYGRLRLSNVFGTGSLQVPMQLQFWSGNSWVPNSDDSCTIFPLTSVGPSGATGTLIATPPTVSCVASPTNYCSGSDFKVVGGLSYVKLTAAATASGSIYACENLGSDPSPGPGTVCSAVSSAGMPFLQGRWPPGTSYDNDPAARATFGVYAPESRKTVHIRESY
jgi:hypothetical protein